MDSREQNINMHIKSIDERCIANQDKILNDATLTPDQIVELRIKQEQYQQALTWLINIKNNVFPPRILKPSN